MAISRNDSLPMFAPPAGNSAAVLTVSYMALTN